MSEPPAPVRAPLTPGAHIGFAGLGRMGQPMAARLAAAGYHVTGFDVSSAARAAAAVRAPEVALTAEPDRAVAGADAVVLMVPDSRVVAALLDGPLGAALQPGQVVIEMSSSEPAETMRHAAALGRRGVVLVDAPVSGGVSGAEAGTLTIMTGGPDADADYVRPLLGQLGSRVLHVGGTGAGHAVKALNNLMSACNLLASAEAMGIARRCGLDLEIVLHAVNTSTGQSASTEVKWPRYILGEQYNSGFGLRLMLKDMQIALQLAAQTDAPSTFTGLAAQLWGEAAAELPADADHTEIARWLHSLAS